MLETPGAQCALNCPRWKTACLVRIPGRINQWLARQKSEEVQLGRKAAIYAKVSTADQSYGRQLPIGCK